MVIIFQNLTIINYGADRESWNLYEYHVYDEDYLLWTGYIENPDATFDDFSEEDKNLIRLNLLFKNKATIKNNGRTITITDTSANGFIDWLLYIDDYHFRKNIHIEKILITNGRTESNENYVTEYNSRTDAIYDTTVICKNATGNVISFYCKNAINVLKESYLKKDIEIFLKLKEVHYFELFTITIKTNGCISMPVKFLEKTLLPGALPENVKAKIEELKAKENDN